MPRENAEAKGRRYLLEGRLLVELVDAQAIRARCRGNGKVYRLGYDAERWYCDCPAIGACSHLVALRLVTAEAAA